MNTQNQQIFLAKRPELVPSVDTFGFRQIPMDQLENGQVLVKTLYLSVDPYMRGRMNSGKSYIEPFALNEPITGALVGEVIKSNSAGLNVGDKVLGFLPWQLYNAVNDNAVMKLTNTDVPLSAYLSVFGTTGLTAYFGIQDIGKPKSGETVVISSAAGAVGSIAGQIAKIQGARVVGIVGSDEKIVHIEKKLGFDKGINYNKVDDLQKALEEACPNGVDVYFDNVGGKITDAVLSLLNNFARIPLCGTISNYNTNINEDIGPRIQHKLLTTRSLLKGFLITDYTERFNEGLQDLAEWLSAGKLKYEETITEGFENAPKAFLDLFTGTIVGKQLVKVSNPTQI